MAQRSDIYDLTVDEFSLVDRPANAEAVVKIYKRAEPSEESMTNPADTFVASLRKALVAVPGLDEAAITKIDAALAETSGLLKAATAPEDLLDGGEDDATETPPKTKKKVAMAVCKSDGEEENVPVKKNTDTTSIEKSVGEVALEKRLAAAEGTIEQFQKRERVATIRKRLEDAHVFTDVQKMAEHLDGLPKEAATFFETQIVDGAKLAKSAGLFEQTGKAGRAEAGSAQAEMEQKVQKRVAEKGEHPEVAYAEVYKADADLRKRLREEGV